MITLFLVVLHIVVSLVLILVVLLQTGKRADLAGAFGGGGSGTAFGARGAATFLSKATTWSAILFMVTSIVLGVRFGAESGSSVVREPASGSAPAAPLPGGTGPDQPSPQQPAPVPAQPVPVPPPGGTAPTGTTNPGAPSPAGGTTPAPAEPKPATEKPAPEKPPAGGTSPK